MIITRQSPLTGKVNQMDIDIIPEQYELWEKGMLIQDAMPDLTAEEREFLISGSTPQDWEEMFG